MRYAWKSCHCPLTRWCATCIRLPSVEGCRSSTWPRLETGEGNVRGQRVLGGSQGESQALCARNVITTSTKPQYLSYSYPIEELVNYGNLMALHWGYSGVLLTHTLRHHGLACWAAAGYEVGVFLASVRCRMRNMSRRALPRWLISFLRSRGISAKVQPRPGTWKIGS